MYKEKLNKLIDNYNLTINKKNRKTDFYNGIYDRWENPVLTRDHIPYFWKYNLNEEENPDLIETLGVNAVFNSGAIFLNGKYYLVARVEGNDRKSFFAVAESDNGVDGFKFWDYPVLLPDTEKKKLMPMICDLLNMKTDGFMEYSALKVRIHLLMTYPPPKLQQAS